MFMTLYRKNSHVWQFYPNLVIINLLSKKLFSLSFWFPLSLFTLVFCIILSCLLNFLFSCFISGFLAFLLSFSLSGGSTFSLLVNFSFCFSFLFCSFSSYSISFSFSVHFIPYCSLGCLFTFFKRFFFAFSGGLKVCALTEVEPSAMIALLCVTIFPKISYP